MDIERILKLMLMDKKVSDTLNDDIVNLEKYVPDLEKLVRTLINNLVYDEDIVLLETMSFLHLLIIDNMRTKSMKKNKFFKQAELN